MIWPLLWIFLIVVQTSAWAGEIGVWLDSQMIPGSNTPCCGPADCHHTQVHRVNGHWEATNLKGNWIVVPDDKIKWSAAPPDGSAWMCDNGGRTVYCFMMGGQV